MQDGAAPERRLPHKRLFPIEKRAHEPSEETPYPADMVSPCRILCLGAQQKTGPRNVE